MDNPKSLSRLAGLLYLIVVVTGIFSLMYVPGQINAQASLDNIRLHEGLFRWGIAVFVLNQIAFVLLPCALYGLLQHVHRGAATLMVALVLASVPLALTSLVGKLDALDPSLAQQGLASYRHGLLVTNIFWGLWLLPLGFLVFKSGMFPRIFGLLFMLGCLGYLIDVFGAILNPHYGDSLLASVAMLPGAVGEIGFCFWLLIVGVRK